MENKGKPMRAVVVFDIELDGGFDVAAEFQAELKAFSQQFADRYEKGGEANKTKVGQHVTFTQTKSELLLSERRGPTGALNNIVFRGTRGPNLDPDIVMPKYRDPKHKNAMVKAAKDLLRDGVPAKEITKILAESSEAYLKAVPFQEF
jgi:hypothetical protein